MEKGKELQFNKKKKQSMTSSLHPIGLADGIKHLSLTVSPYSQHHAETYFQEHRFYFFFLFLNKYLYLHKCVL